MVESLDIGALPPAVSRGGWPALLHTFADASAFERQANLLFVILDYFVYLHRFAGNVAVARSNRQERGRWASGSATSLQIVFDYRTND